MSVETSQIWKDLQRDSIIINNEHIKGESSGTEAMIGSLMRHIMDRVDLIRSMDGNESNETEMNHSYSNNHLENINSYQNTSNSTINTINSTINQSNSMNNQSNNQTNMNNNNHRLSKRKQKVLSRFDITESQALACARDLLILCNRTQSGGDTYFCVDSLLCNKLNDLCIIVPIASNAEPIAIFIDIVEEKRVMDDYNHFHGNETRGRSRSVHTVDGNATNTMNNTLNNSNNQNNQTNIQKDNYKTLKIDMNDSSNELNYMSSSTNDIMNEATNNNKTIINELNTKLSPMKPPLQRRQSETVSSINKNRPKSTNFKDIQSKTNQNKNIIKNNDINNNNNGLNKPFFGGSVRYMHELGLDDIEHLTTRLENELIEREIENENNNNNENEDSDSENEDNEIIIETDNENNDNNNENNDTTEQMIDRIFSNNDNGSSSSPAPGANDNQSIDYTESTNTNTTTTSHNSMSNSNSDKQNNRRNKPAKIWDEHSIMSDITNETHENTSINSLNNNNNINNNNHSLNNNQLLNNNYSLNNNNNNNNSVKNDKVIIEIPLNSRSHSDPTHSNTNTNTTITDEMTDNSINSNSNLNDINLYSKNHTNSLNQIESLQLTDSLKYSHENEIQSTSMSKSKSVPTTATNSNSKTRSHALYKAFTGPFKNFHTPLSTPSHQSQSNTHSNSHSQSQTHSQQQSQSQLQLQQSQLQSQQQFYEEQLLHPHNSLLPTSHSSPITPNISYKSIQQSQQTSQSQSQPQIQSSPFKFFGQKRPSFTNQSQNINISPIASTNSNITNNNNDTTIQNERSYCIRIEVQVNSRYRICDSNPQDDLDSIMGEVLGQFQQVFFIKSGCKGRPVVTDRIVTVAVDKAKSLKVNTNTSEKV